MKAARAMRVAARSIASLIVFLSVVPVSVLAAECSLNGPHAINVGGELSIEGAGFPVSSSVAITVTIADGPADQFAVQSNSAGEIVLALTPESADEGTMTVTAESGSACSARLEVEVVAAGAPLPPAPTPSGGTAGAAGEGGPPPRTDAGAPGLGGGVPWLLGAIVLGMGALGLVLGRAPRRR
jgi:hypothetical protein